MATYEAAWKRWSGNCLTLREGSRVIAHSRHRAVLVIRAIGNAAAPPTIAAARTKSPRRCSSFIALAQDTFPPEHQRSRD
jgi:hypothetical protein